MPSKIEYVDETYNPMSGCTKISPGCENCYAERMARRLAGRFGYPDAPHHFDVTLHPDRLEKPFEWRRDARILLPSMGDLFHEDVPDEFITSVLGITATSSAPFYSHTYLLLTKRPERMREYAEAHENLWAVANIWPMVSVENADYLWRIEELLKIPGVKHGVSIEPMLGPLDIPKRMLNPYPEHVSQGFDAHTGKRRVWERPRPRLDWVVLGGETGPGARPMHPDWVRKVRDDCVAAGVDFFFKGWGAWGPAECWGEAAYSTARKHIWPRASARERTRLLGLHEGVMVRLGKKAAGRLLDGREWNEIPGTDV